MIISQERLEKSGFSDIMHDIIENGMISCMISCFSDNIIQRKKGGDYDIIHDIMVFI